MDKEYKQLRPLFPENKLILQKSGIATVNAAIQAVEMIRQYKPDCIISSGCAGGNGNDINLQDVVVSSELTYHDVYCGKAIDDTTVYGQVQGLPARYQADPYLLEKAKLTGAKPGLIVTGDWFVDSKKKMAEIIHLFPDAKAVDMESCAIAQVCYIYKVPFISFRVISDIPLRDTDASQYHNFWDTVAENSFQVTKTFKPGIYVSREDKGFTTFDLRITEPNKEPAVAPAAMHSIEHLMATWFRNSEAKDDVVYVGPMGCLTGMYIIMTGTYTVEDMRRLTIACLQWILKQTEVPATEPQSCGNYLLHDLPMCKWECARYLDRLQNDFHCEYTKLQITLDDGKIFADA